jgi:hypothetical protein
MRPTSRFVETLVVAVASLLIASQGCGNASRRGKVDCFDTPAWAEAGGLELRVEPPGASLLLRHRTTAARLLEERPAAVPGAVAKPAATYRFDPDGAKLDRADERSWQAAGTEVVDCDLQSAVPVTPFVLDGEARSLRFRDRAVKAAGRSVLLLAPASRGDRVAVLSASGSGAAAILPFLSRGGASGTHYSQIFRASDGTEEGEAVPLPMTSERVALSGCFSADERYVVYTDVLFNQLCIVQPQVPGGDGR